MENISKPQVNNGFSQNVLDLTSYDQQKKLFYNSSFNEKKGVKMVEIDQTNNKIIYMLANGCQIMEIAANIHRSKRFILYRISDLKISFNCKTTAQLIYTLTIAGLLK